MYTPMTLGELMEAQEGEGIQFGFMGPTMGKIEGVLPNYGVGLRIEVQPRMNVRLDLGKNTVNDQTLFYFNMTEAF